MRKFADIRDTSMDVARVILFENVDGVYVFPCASLQDGSATGDYWFSSVQDGEDWCAEEFGVQPEDWQSIEDPLPFCQHDWLAPVRIKGRPEGDPQWSVYERLENGEWHEFKR